MKCIEHEGEVYAVVVGPDNFAPGIKFVSEEDWGLQVGIMLHPRGHTIQAHRHNLQPNRVIPETQEFLFVIAGTMEVTLYARDGHPFHTEELKTGYGILQVKGGHGFRFAESSRVLEIKQGPYLAKELDKSFIVPRGQDGQVILRAEPICDASPVRS